MLNIYNLEKISIKFRIGKDLEALSKLAKALNKYTKNINKGLVLEDEELRALNEINECLSKKDYIRVADIIDYEL